MADKNEVELGKNCGQCKKALKRRKRYYRNGAYYCNKNCFDKKQEALQAEKAGQAA